MTLINKITVTGPLIVLTIGLISCSPEKPHKDQFSIQEPEVITEKTKVARITNLDPQSAWNFEDRIRFQEQNRDNLRLAVHSACKSALNGAIFEGSTTRSLPREISIGELLPVTLLTRKNPKIQTQFQCAFQVSVFNDKGSKHTFRLPNRMLEEPPTGSRNFNIQNNGSPLETKPGEWPVLHSDNLEKYWLLSPKADQFQLYCNDLKADLNAMADFVSIIEVIKSTSAEKLQSSIQRSPEQVCRVLALQNQVLQGWSPYFNLVWENSKLEITQQIKHNQIYWYPNEIGHTRTLYEVRIKNPYPFPVYFSIPNINALPVLILTTSGHSLFKSQYPLSITYNKATTGLVVNDKAPYRVGLNSGASAVFSVSIQVQAGCPLMDAGAIALPFDGMARLRIKRFENLTDDYELGTQDFLHPALDYIRNSRTSGINIQVPVKTNIPGC